jgi:hypothetical protein
MSRTEAIQLLFWFHARERWQRDFLQYGSFVWPPFPREDEFRHLRISLHQPGHLRGDPPAHSPWKF